MTISKRYTAPTLPLPPADYAQTYGNELIKVLRLYFNDNDSTVNAIIALLNAGGYFPVLNAGTITADQFTGGNFSGLNATLAAIAAQTITGNIQGGDGVFNQLTGSNVNASLFTGSGRQINFPHIAALDLTDQVAGGDDTPTVVEWNTLDYNLGWTLASDVFTAEFNGIYKITYRLQLINSDAAIHYATVWLEKNGSDVANSATIFHVPARKSASAGEEGYLCAYSEFTFEAEAGDDIELYWATDLAGNPVGPVDGVYIFHDAAQVSPPYDRPAIPSAIGSIVYLSAPPDPKTQITPIGVRGTGFIGTLTLVVQNNT